MKKLFIVNFRSIGMYWGSGYKLSNLHMAFLTDKVNYYLTRIEVEH